MNRCAITLLVAVVACHGDSAPVPVAGPTSPPAGSISAVAGDGQVGWTDVALPFQLIVMVTDLAGNPYQGKAVAWSAVSGGGHFDETSTLTGSDGHASVTFTPGSAGGAQSVHAMVDGNQSVTFTATGVTMELSSCGGDGQFGTPGQLAPIAPCVVLTNGHGPVVGATVQWTVNGSGIALPATSKTDATGKATTIFSFGPPLATPSILAITAGTAAPLSFTETSSFVPATPGAAGYTYASVGDNQSGTTGTPLATPIGVKVTNAAREPITGLVISWAAGASGGHVSPALSITGVDGIATTALTLGSNPGTETVTASVNGVGAVATLTAAAVAPVIPVVPVCTVTNGDGLHGLAGTTLAVPIIFFVTDASCQRIPGQVVTWTMGPGGGSVTPTTSISDAQGLASVTFTFGNSLGPETVTASAVTAGGVRAHTFTETVIAPLAPVTPQLVATIPAPSGSALMHDSYVRDGIAFLCAYNMGVVIYDVGNGIRGGLPGSPVLISQILTGSSPAGGSFAHNAWWFHNPVSHENRYLFVGQEGPLTVGTSSTGDIHIVDVSDLSAPREVGFIHVPGAGTHNFWMDEGRQILYAAYYNGGVIAVDVSGTLSGDMSSRIVEHVTPGGAGNTYVWGVMLANGVLYASDMLSGFWALDPVTLATIGGGNNVADRYGSDLWVTGQYGYTGTWGTRGTERGDAVKIWALGPSGTPTLADSLVIPNVGIISDVAVTPDGKMLVVTTEAGSENGLYVYDLVNPRKPQLRAVALVTMGIHTGQVAVINGRTYVFAARDPGAQAILIYDITAIVP